MFIEPTIDDQKNPSSSVGWIEVICGSMFSGKTEELIRRLTRAKIAGLKVEIFKPTLDKRYSDENVVSHNQNAIRSTPVNFAGDIPLLASNSSVVGIDEAQFFDRDLVSVCQQLANNGKRLIVAGLDMDFAGQPFEPMPQLMAVAEYITKVRAICMKCGNIASYSYRLTHDQAKVLIGEKDTYQARCRKCFFESNKNDK